jgi:Family of unknown function (DUF6232)
MDPAIFKDGAFTVTPTEIRYPGLTVYLRNVTSVSVTTFRPGRFAPLALLPLGVIALCPQPLSPVVFHFSSLLLLPLIPCVAGLGVYFLLRVSRLSLQTAGGTVVLAQKMSLSKPTETLERFERIRRAIEGAISSQAETKSRSRTN